MRLMLVSNTGTPYYEHCRAELAGFLGPSTSVAFVTAASLVEEARYFQLARESLEGSAAVGELLHVPWQDEGVDLLDRVDAVFVGGGNTFVLLHRLLESGLLDAIRKRVEGGLAYVGVSAGANVCGPNVLTTNDWNVISLTSFEALGFVPFNLNPHYLERGSPEARASETRDDRIREYHVLWSNPVIGLEEETLLQIEDGVARVAGRGRARLFERMTEPRWFASGDALPLELRPPV